MLSNQQINNFKQQLQQTKQRLEEQINDSDDFGLSRNIKDSTGELSNYDNHPADQGTELYEREKDLALGEHTRDEIRDIDRALKAIDEGQYGKCEVCSIEIPLERLNIIPTTTFCVEHSPSQETSDNRPVEEEVLGPSFSTHNCDGTSSVGYDGEDAWQDVARFGSSDTPSDLTYPPSDYEHTYIDSYENVGFVEDYENIVGVDLYGENVTVYHNEQYREIEDTLIEEDTQTPFGDLPRYEKDPYVEEENQ